MHSKAPIIAVVVFVVLISSVLFAAAQIPISEHIRITSELRGQLDTIKWIGGAMVAGLVSAVGVLWSALQKESKQQDARTYKMIDAFVSKLVEKENNERS